MIMFGIQKKIKKIMDMKITPDQKDVKLRELAKSCGCSLDSTYDQPGKHFSEEVIRRIQESARSNRESFLWLIG